MSKVTTRQGAPRSRARRHGWRESSSRAAIGTTETGSPLRTWHGEWPKYRATDPAGIPAGPRPR